MGKQIIALGSLFGVLAVIIGAFGAHGLDGKISPDQIGTFETGVQYHFYHTFGILICGVLMYRQNNPLIKRAAYFMSVGILFFSFSLYLLACRNLLQIEHWSWLGPITPIGGVFFILGWATLGYAALKSK